MSKLKGLPTLYYLNLDERPDRREYTELQYDETEISGPLVDTEEDNDDIEELIAELEDDEIEKPSEEESDLLESDFMALLGDDEKVDVMHQDLNQAIEDNPRDTSYTMEEQVENQIYYDIEELLKEI